MTKHKGSLGMAEVHRDNKRQSSMAVQERKSLTRSLVAWAYEVVPITKHKGIVDMAKHQRDHSK